MTLPQTRTLSVGARFLSSGWMIRVDGEVDETNTEILKQVVTSVIDRATEREKQFPIVIDFSQCGFDRDLVVLNAELDQKLRKVFPDVRMTNLPRSTMEVA